jgi:predicted DNA-binding protein YlxM (UPF0122 family)
MTTARRWGAGWATDERAHAIVRLYQEGYDMREIAVHFGISRQRVSQIIQRSERIAREQQQPLTRLRGRL